MYIVYLLVIIVLAYMPYKTRQRHKFINLPWPKALLLSVWFFICAAALIIPTVPHGVSSPNVFSVGGFFVIITVWFCAPRLLGFFGSRPDKYIKNHPARFLVRFEPPVLLLKFCEVLFQQAMFAYIIFVVSVSVMNPQKIILFTIIIAILHIANILFMERRETIIFFLLSIPMALLFGMLIMHGYILVTASIHLVFYLIFNGRYWIGSRYETVLSD